MPNIQSAKKRARQNVQRRKHNMGLRSHMRSLIKKFRALTEEQPEQAGESYRTVASVLDRSARKHLVHRNKVARLKSRLNRRLQQAGGSS